MTIRAETEVTLTRVNDGDNGVKVYDGTAGSVVTVSNASEYPALELVANIEPIQPNDYDSVWVGGAGKNVCEPLEGTKNGIVRTLNDDGTVAITGTSTANSWSYLEEYYDLPYEGIDVGDTISIYSDVYIAVMAYNGTTSLGSKSAKDGNSATYTIPANTTRLRIIQYPKSVTPVVDEVFNTTAKYWVSKSAFSSWEPYENICPIYGHDHCNVVVSPTLLDTDGTTYTINFPQIVYGGTLDVVKGILTVTYDNIASYNGETLNGEWLSDRDVYVSGTTPTTGAQVVYELGTPIVYSVSPKDIELITGTCNVWATTGDITDFRYAEIAPATLETFGEARKIAVKYVTDMGDDGIIVHPENDTSNYAKINAEGMDIVKNNDSVAFYGDISRVGKATSSRTLISDTGIELVSSDGALAFSVVSGSVSRDIRVVASLDGIYYPTTTNKTVAFDELNNAIANKEINIGFPISNGDGSGSYYSHTFTKDGTSQNYTENHVSLIYDGTKTFQYKTDGTYPNLTFGPVKLQYYMNVLVPSNSFYGDILIDDNILHDANWYTEARIVLWTNPNPGDNFSAQTVSLYNSTADVSAYDCDEIEIYYINTASDARWSSVKVLTDKVYQTNETILAQGASAQNRVYSRLATLTTTPLTSTMEFKQGYYQTTAGAGYCIPQQIIGIKHI